MTVELGITVGRSVEFLARRGFGLPVVRGYPDITVGGCVAFDVHGKSQLHSGNFGEWVEELDLVHPRHGRVSCSRAVNAKTFELTVGGLGLCGVILAVRLRTERLAGSAIELVTLSARCMLHAAELMESKAHEVAALYSGTTSPTLGETSARASSSSSAS